MKVLIANNMAPFLWGGAEELAVHLEKNLIAAGHEAEIVRIPFQLEPATRIPSQMLLVRALEVVNVDRVIALKFPAYLIRHPVKTLWLLHQYRQAYDLLDAGLSNLPFDRTGGEIRRLIKSADEQSFAECRRIFTNSNVTRDRLKKYNNVDSEVLLPPLNDPELFTGGPSEGYIFAGGRINAGKRQALLVEAMVHAPKNVRLVIAGPPDKPEDEVELTKLVESLGLADRVKLDIRFLPRETLAKYVNGSTACAYLPFDEDSLGYVAMEAATAAKPIISTSDSGGVLGLARHLETGWVTEPEPRALAAALNEAVANPSRSLAMGCAARELWLKMGINWSGVIERLLS